jgi:hypothetical protein
MTHHRSKRPHQLQALLVELWIFDTCSETLARQQADPTERVESGLLVLASPCMRNFVDKSGVVRRGESRFGRGSGLRHATREHLQRVASDSIALVFGDVGQHL